MNIHDLLKQGTTKDKGIYLNGVIKGKHYSVVFLPTSQGDQPFVLFEDGTNCEVQTDKQKSFFEYFGTKYVFLNGPKLECAPEVINYPDVEGVRLVVKQAQIEEKKLYYDLKNILEEYYDFYCEEELRIVIVHIIHSYLISSIGSTFYLFLEGEINTGKSSLQKIMALLQYNGCFIGQTTVPALARKLHYSQATVNIDEFDKAFKQQDEQAKALGFFDTGFYKGGTYEITDQNGKTIKEQLKVIQTFSAKTFSANRTRVAKSFESRCVTIQTVRGNRKTKTVNRINDQDKAVISEIRDRLFALTLMEAKGIIQAIEEFATSLADKQQYNREAEILSIICGIEKFFGQDDKVEKYLTDASSLSEEDGQEIDRTYIMFEFLLKRIVDSGTGNEEIQFTNAELVDHINSELCYEDSSEEELPFGKFKSRYEATPSSVGKALKLHKIIVSPNERSRTSKGYGKGRWEYKVQRQRILDILKRSSYKKIQQKVADLENYIALGKSDTSLPF